VAGRCVVDACLEGRFDLNGDPGDGCEGRPDTCEGEAVDLQSDPRHCGACGRDCRRPPARPAFAAAVACDNSFCVATECAGEELERGEVEVSGVTVAFLLCGPGEAPPECRPGDEVCNGIDDDCDHQVDEGLDARPELCDGEDNNCNGLVDEGFADLVEACDGIDNDCDHVVDEGFADQVELCNGIDDDCDGVVDNLPADVVEVCNGRDDDCDGEVDEDQPTISCGVGACAELRPGCVDGRRAECPAAVAPDIAERCNGVDDDCDGETDEGLGSVTCGTGACRREVRSCVDGVEQRCEPGRPAGEVCNGVDDDCDDEVDELVATCGVGACEREMRICVEGAERRCTGLPPGREVCNGIDDDCDGDTDEGLVARCGLGACARTAPVCLDGAPVACEPAPAADEVCDGVDGDCDGVHDLDDGVCPGCVGAGQRVELGAWVADVDHLSFALTMRGSTVLVAWRDTEQLVVVGCDDEADFVGRQRHALQGPPVGGLRWVADTEGEVNLLHEWRRADADDVEVRRLTHLRSGADGLGDPVDVVDRVTCREEPLVVVETRVDAPQLEVVGITEACDFAEVQLQVAALVAGGWRHEVRPLEVQAGNATVCGAWRLPAGGGRGALGVVTTAVSDAERADGVLDWRLDLLTPGLAWDRVGDPNAAGDQAQVDARGCPYLAVVDDQLVRITLAMVDQTPTVVRVQLSEDGAWLRREGVGVVPVDGDVVRRAYVNGTFQAIQVGRSGWAAAWVERTPDGPTLQMSTHTEQRASVGGCEAIAGGTVTLVPAARPLLLWSGSALDGVDGDDPALYALFAGTQVERCGGVLLGGARGAGDYRAVPVQARGESVALYWLTRAGGVGTLHRARLDVGNARARAEVLAAQVDLHADPPYVVRRGADGLHHLVFATAQDDGRRVLEYRALQAP